MGARPRPGVRRCRIASRPGEQPRWSQVEATSGDGRRRPATGRRHLTSEGPQVRTLLRPPGKTSGWTGWKRRLTFKIDHSPVMIRCRRAACSVRLRKFARSQRRPPGPRTMHAAARPRSAGAGRRPADQRRGGQRSHREGRCCAAEGWERCHVRVKAWCIIEKTSAMLIGTASAVAMFIPTMCLVVEIPSK